MAKLGYSYRAGSSPLDSDAPNDVRIRFYYQSLEAHRLAKISEEGRVTYQASVYLSEALDLSPQNSMLPFLVNFETKPRGFTFKVKGLVFIEGSPQSIKRWVHSVGDTPPLVWRHIHKSALKVVEGVVRGFDVSLPKEFAQGVDF